MKKLFIALGLAAFALGAQAQYQMANSNFEAWSASSGEPDHWHGFKSATGGLASSAKGTLAKSEDKPSGSKGTYSAVITSGSTFGIINNGTMTTGQLRAASMSATNTNNHAEMDGSSSATDKNGDRFYMPITGHPDAIKFWLKFSQGTAQSTYKYASMNAVITDGSYYQDPEDKTYNNKVAQAKNATITTCSWSEFTVPFEYLSNSVNPAAILCTFGTNATPGKGSDGDKVWVDDVELVYWHALTALSYNGESVPAFSETTTSYDLSSIEYDAAAPVTYTLKGRGATVSKSYNAETGVLTIRVEGEDYGTDASMFQNDQSFTEYTVQFKHKVSEKTYTEDLYVSLGDYTADKQVADVLVETYNDGTINFILKNFIMEGMPVGNIEVNEIQVTKDGSFAFNGGIAIAPGDDPEIDSWMGPGITEDCGGSVPLDLNGKFIGDDHIVVYISINIAEFVGYPVEVHLGYARLAPGAMYVYAEAQYGTFCAPFAVEIPEGVRAYTVPSVTGGVLDLNELTGTIPANTPVVLYSENGYESTEEVFEVPEEGTPTFGLLTGVYEEGYVPVGSYVLQLKYLDDEGESYKVGFYKVVEDAQPYSLANRCYLTVPASGGIKEAFFFNEDDATGIKAMVNGQWSMDNAIYNLAGQRMSKMQKGVNIVNGKKILY